MSKEVGKYEFKDYLLKNGIVLWIRINEFDFRLDKQEWLDAIPDFEDDAVFTIEYKAYGSQKAIVLHNVYEPKFND